MHYLRRRILTLCAAGLFLASPNVVKAQVAPYRLNDKEMKALLEHIEQGADKFRHSLKKAVDKSPIDETRTENRINSFVKDFEEATDKLRDRFNSKNSASADVEEVLRRAALIEDFMGRHPLDVAAQADWKALRTDLLELSRAYGVTADWLDHYPPLTSELPRSDVSPVMERIRRDEDGFRRSLEDSLITTRLDDRDTEEVKAELRDFDLALDRYRDRTADSGSAAADAAREVLRRAAVVDSFMRQRRMTSRAIDDWRLLRRDLEDLGRIYDLSIDWDRMTITRRIG